MKSLVIIAINFYKKYISPFLPHSCRFNPSCSTYCLDAVKKYGVSRGFWLFAKRIIRCHPLHTGGYDPVERIENSYLK